MSYYNESKIKGIPYDMYLQSVSFAIKNGEISSPMLQRELNIPYHISAMLMDLLELNRVISDEETGSKRKKVLINS